MMRSNNKKVSFFLPVPLVANVHTTLSRAMTQATTFQFRTLIRAVRWCYPRMDAIATVSRGAAEDLVRKAKVAPRRVRREMKSAPDRFGTKVIYYVEK